MTDTVLKISDIDFSTLPISELNEIIKKATAAKEARKTSEINKIKAELEDRLGQFDLTFDDIFPKQTQESQSRKAKAAMSKASSDLEETEKGVTYFNPVNTTETWTAGVKKGRAPTWVTELRVKGELHRYKVEQ